MKILPSNLIIEKNKIGTTSAWLMLLEIILGDGIVLYLVKNNENITFQGQEYTAINFDIDETKESSKGELPTLSLTVTNISRLLQAYVEEYEGGIGYSVKLTVVNSENLAEDYAELEITFEIVGCYCTAQWVTFTLGIASPLKKRFPQHRYIANYCNWKFKSAECGYAGSEAFCGRRLEDCRAYNNSARFGGFIGLANVNVRYA